MSASPLLCQLSATTKAAITGESREGNFVDLATVGTFYGVMFCPFFFELGQLISDGSLIHVELTTAIETRYGYHEQPPPSLPCPFFQSLKA